MMLIQLFGLSGAGKTTLAQAVKSELISKNLKVEIIDGDEYRKVICKDLSFSKDDRMENIRRLGFIGNILARNGVIAILSAINPYEAVREELKSKYQNVYTIWLECPIDELIKRDTKGLYYRALLPGSDPDKINNLTGINDTFELPIKPDLVINTSENDLKVAKNKLLNFIFGKMDQSVKNGQSPESPVKY
jgi:adenylylsulfate kinase